MFTRLANITKSNSFFLFGARGTGKSTLIKKILPDTDRYDIDLLDASNARLFMRDPSRLSEITKALPAGKKWIFIDEIQKIPELLDVVHKLIEETSIKFALTGSSARKLKRGGANLLAARAFVYHLFPLTFVELENQFDLDSALLWGGLPKLYNLEDDLDRAQYLETYVNTYLKEEILEEQLLRKVEPFNRFLEILAQSSGDTVNYSNIAKDIDSNHNSVKTYFEITEDTLIGFRLLPYSRSIRKRQGAKPKFYLFDNGVTRTLNNTLRAQLPPWGNEYGRLFESLVVQEFFRFNEYFKRSFKFSFLRVDEDLEIDLIIETPDREQILVEIKSSDNISDTHLADLLHFSKDFPHSKKYLLSKDPTKRIVNDINVVYWQDGLREIFKLPRQP